MKREILYKAERVDNGGLIEGFLTYGYGTGTFLIAHSNGWQPSFSNPDEGESTMYTKIKYKTVSQFIRLDSDKKRVFEGDILDEEYTAKWSDEKCGFYLESKFGSDHNKPMSFIDENNLKITGNIHDKTN